MNLEVVITNDKTKYYTDSKHNSVKKKTKKKHKDKRNWGYTQAYAHLNIKLFVFFRRIPYFRCSLPLKNLSATERIMLR